jgi:phosphoribosyl 1,2-cyclic phosphodiesterase
MSLKFCLLSSGSCGNAALIKTDKLSVLIDFGCSSSYICQALEDFHIDAKKLDAVLITHAHMDHLSASGFKFLCKNNIPVYLHRDILDDIYAKFGGDGDDLNVTTYDGNFEIKDILIKPFDVYHKDSFVSRTMGFAISIKIDERIYKIGYATDTGKISEGIKKVLADSNILAIEANYDEELLQRSFRPHENKKWILSEFGHLGNTETAKAICDIKNISTGKDSLKYVFLSHISKSHNNCETALRTVKKIILENKISGINLLAAPRKQKSRTIKI